MSGPGQNPYPAPPAAPAAPGGYDYLAGARNVGFEQRDPPPPLGAWTGAIKSIRRHNSALPGGKPGLLISLDQIDGLPPSDERAVRITFGGQFPAYAQRDCKRLCAAILGYAFTDPRAAALDGPDMWAVFDATARHVGRRVAGFTTEGKANPKTGEPYVNTRFSTVGDTTDPDAHGSGPASAAPTPASPAPAPAPIPAPVSGPPPGWYACPPEHPYHRSHWYNAAGEYREIGA